MATIETLREKFDLLRALEAEHRFGNIVEPGTSLAPIPELPAGTVEVFSLFRRLAGSYFYFKVPPDVRTPEAWRQHRSDEGPLGDCLPVGFEIYSVGWDLHDDGPVDGERVGAWLKMDVNDGHVYYIDPDDYIHLYKNRDATDVHIENFAPDPVTFFDRFVFGPEYTRMADAVLGAGAADKRHRKTGRYVDSWRELLIAADLSE